MDLYRHVPLLGENIPISVDPFQVKALVTTEDEIEWAVKRLVNHHSRGPSGMRAEYLKLWLVEAWKEEVATEKATVSERAVAVIRGTGREET